MKNKAFTLIELLAVIVILAVIAIIAVPIVLNIIEDTNKSAVKRSTENYIDAVELYIARSELDNNKLKLKGNNKYNVNESTLIEDKNYLPINELVEIKGSKPTGKEDYITLDSNGQVIEGKLTISGYIIEISNGKITNVKKDKTIKVKEMSINITEQTMEKNSTFKLIPNFKPIDASNQEVIYESSNTSVVTVDELGNVTAKSSGTAKITVTSKENSSIKAECNITVIVSATSLTISPKDKQIRVGEGVQLSGTIEPGDVTSNALSWSTSNAEIATVNENGLVTGVSAGEVIITGKTVNGIEDTSTITVEVTATGLTVSPKTTELNVGKTVQLTGTVTPDNTVNKTLTWSSSNSNIATVDSNGLVTGVSGGTVTITATTVNGISETSTVNVVTIGKAATSLNKTIAGNIPQGSFTPGDEYIVNVDGIHEYHFYVLNVEGDKVSLIMSNNICIDGTLATSSNTCLVRWVSKTDYNDDTNYGSNGNNNKGPITAMNYLHEVTKNWSNIENIQMNYTDEGNTGSYGYGTITTNENITTITKKDGTITATYSNLKVRMPKLLEMTGVGCVYDILGSCPAWMATGLKAYTDKYPMGTKEDISNLFGYWSLSSKSTSLYQAINGNYCGSSFGDSFDMNREGVRPVIEVLKSDLS